MLKTQGLCGNILTACRRCRPRLFFLSSLMFNIERLELTHEILAQLIEVCILAL